MDAIPATLLSIAFSHRSLCTRCGTCAGSCPVAAIRMGPDLYPVIDPERCIRCGRCHRTCPGGRVDFGELTRLTFGHDRQSETFDGHVVAAYVGYALDRAIQDGGAGGGIITALLADMLRRGIVDGCIVTRMCPEQPWKGEAFIARTPEELRQSQGSRYMIIPVNAIFSQLQKTDGRFAIAALPCQVHGIRLMMREQPALASRIHAVIGLFCGGSLEPGVVTDLLKAKRIAHGDLSGFQFRGGEWPGKMRAILKDGMIRDLHYSNYKDGAYNYLISVYMPPRCQTCIDGSGEFADVSVSDAWTRDADGNYKFKNQSRLLVRTARGAALVADAVTHGALSLSCVSDDPNYRTHRLQTQRKGMNAPLRVERLRKKGIPVPDYDRPVPAHTRKDILKERMASILMGIGRFPRLRFALIAFLTSRAAIPLILLRVYLKKRKYKQGAHPGCRAKMS